MHEKSLSNKLKILKYIYISLLAAQVVFFVLCFYLYLNDFIKPAPESFIFKFTTPFLVILLIFSSRIVYNKRVSRADKSGDIDKKFTSFRNNNIIKWSFLEGANFLVVISFLYTGYILYVILFFIIITLFLLNFPGGNRFVYEYRLNNDEFK